MLMDLPATASCVNPIFNPFNVRVMFLSSSVREPVPLPRLLLDRLF
jgi:hypothetical protein